MFHTDRDKLLRSVRRIGDGPIIAPGMLPGQDGNNINGPSLIKAPSWLKNRLGKYYLYFAHHKGTYIRLAYADDLAGPWKIYAPGSLQIDNCIGGHFPTDTFSHLQHVASPDVHVDESIQRVILYYHTLAYTGGDAEDRTNYRQVTLRAVSDDGLHFLSDDIMLGGAYFRVFRWAGHCYAISRLGTLWRSDDGTHPFEKGPHPFRRLSKQYRLRHAATLLRENTLLVYHSRIGDAPESILCSAIHLKGDWRKWRATKPRLVLKPEKEYEGASFPILPSSRGMSRAPACQLRDPAIFEEEGRTYLLYSVAGEKGIAIAELH